MGLQQGLVEGEDAFDFDAEGELEDGVDHFRRCLFVDIYALRRYWYKSWMCRMSECDFGIEIIYVCTLESCQQA